MSGVRETNIIAVLSADWHLCQRPPAARTGEPDWYKAMGWPILEMRGLCILHECPLIVAGDIGDSWRLPPETINWAIGQLRGFPYGVYAVPGQHDLPCHNYVERHRSAYRTLAEAGVIIDLPPALPYRIGNIVAWGFPWGFDINPPEYLPNTINLAVCHRYIWRKNHGYPGADEGKLVTGYAEKLKGFDAAVFGDNHIGFTAAVSGCHIINPGSLHRRKTDQQTHAPSVGLLHSDGHIERYYLHVEGEVLAPRTAAIVEVEESLEIQDFIQELEALGDSHLDYRDAMVRYVEDNPMAPRTREILLTVLGA